MELKEWWDIEVEEKTLDNKLFRKQVNITIKNHSPYPRKFRIFLKKINVKDTMSNLRIRMYINIASPVELEIEKYSKEQFVVKIPAVYERSKDDNIVIAIQNIETNEEKEIQVFL